MTCAVSLCKLFELEEFEQALLWWPQLLQSDTNDSGGVEDERAIRVTSQSKQRQLS